MTLLSSYLSTLSSAQTRRAYRTDLIHFFGDEDPNASDVEAIAPSAVKSFVRAMVRQGRSMSTQRRRLAALRGFYDWLMENDVVSRNPARHPDVTPLRPDSETSSDVSLSAGDVERMIKVAGDASRSGLRDQALIMTIVFGALRRREVASLEVEDVRPLGRYWILDLETAPKSSGYVRVPETVVEAIEQVKDRYGIMKGPLWRSVSNQNRGAPMTPDAIYKVVRRVSKQAGLDPVSIDTLRRTGLQLALEGGANVSHIQAHGRFTDSTSAARLHEALEGSEGLGDSAVEYIDLDIDPDRFG